MEFFLGGEYFTMNGFFVKSWFDSDQWFVGHMCSPGHQPCFWDLLGDRYVQYDGPCALSPAFQLVGPRVSFPRTTGVYAPTLPGTVHHIMAKGWAGQWVPPCLLILYHQIHFLCWMMESTRAKVLSVWPGHNWGSQRPFWGAVCGLPDQTIATIIWRRYFPFSRRFSYWCEVKFSRGYVACGYSRPNMRTLLLLLNGTLERAVKSGNSATVLVNLFCLGKI